MIHPRTTSFSISEAVAALVTATALLTACSTDLSTPRSAGAETPSENDETPEPAAGRGARVDAASAALSVHAVLGVPVDGDASDDVLLDETSFLVSYNPRLRGPNWVEWRLSASDLGTVRRHDSFRADDALPDGMYRATPREFAHTPYDRGHLCPFGDRNGTREAARRTFLMTNMEPELHELNAGPWEKLEEYERVEARARDSTLYIVAGGVFDAEPPRLGHGVAVPRATFKIVVLLERGEGASDVTAATPTVAVEMPNERGVGHRPWQSFVTSIDRVEADTGYDFLGAVPVAVQAVLEARAPHEL